MPTRGSKKMSGVLYDKPGKIEHYEKRFGLIAIEKAYISAEDVVKTFTIQVSEDVAHQSH